MPPLELETFELEQAAFEVRYPTAYQLWDRAGALWSAVQDAWPAIELIQADPMKQSFRLANVYEIAVELKKAQVSSFKPEPSLKELRAFLDTYFGLLVKFLDLSVLNRVGFRLRFYREFDKAAAAAAVMQTDRLRVPDGAHFSIEGAVTLPEFGLRWEGKSLGVMVRLTAEDRKYDFEPHPMLKRVEPVHFATSGVLLDIDYYTVGIVKSSQLRVDEWIKQAHHVIKRDIGSFLKP